MTDFLLAAIGLLVLAALFIITPLFLRARAQRLEISNANVIKQRIAELEDEVSQGLISEKDKVSAIRELKLALVDETQETVINEHSSTVPSVLVIVLALPALIIGTWVYIDTNHLKELGEYQEVLANAEALSEKVMSANNSNLSPDDYARFALIIRERLRTTPEDAQGWMFLGQTQLAIGRLDESIAAFERSLQIKSDDDVRVRYINALITTATEDALTKAQREVTRLITSDGSNRQYRLLQTVIAAQRGDARRAGESFAMIKDQLAGQSDFYRSLITQLRSIGVDEALLSDKDTTLSATSIDVALSIADDLRSKLPTSGYLIVFAQDAESGSPMPLAVKRLALPDFPLQLRLSMADAMVPNMNLESAKRVKLVARISEDSDVSVTEGELQGSIASFDIAKGQQMQAYITIDQEL